MNLRLSRAPLLSWVALGVLVVAVGCVFTLFQPVTPLVIGLAAIALGVLIIGATLRVSARVTLQGVHVQNRLRRIFVPADEITAIGSRVVETPMTRAMGWGQIEIRDARHQRVPLAASTGIDESVLERLMASLRECAPSARVEVNEAIFPTVTGHRRR